jgi:hypothetical protein
MASPTSAIALDGPSRWVAEEPAAPAPDRRRDKRFKVSLRGRFMRENKQEHTCKLRDISGCGAALLAPVDLESGERIVAYFDHIGGLEGVVVRTFEGGFAIELQVTPHKREKLVSQLAWLSDNRNQGLSFPQRRHERFAVDNETTTLRLAEDISTQVRVLDVSISGASVETEARPAIGSEVVLGKLRAKVVRHHVEGLGLEFIDIQNPDALRRYFG